MGFKVGDIVEVIDNGYSFTNNEYFFIENKIALKTATRYIYGSLPPNGLTGRIVAIGDLEFYDYKGIVIQDDTNREMCCLVGEPGLKFLKKNEFKPHLECTKVFKVNYGTIGKQTNLVDCYGRPLKVGDTVIIRAKDGSASPEVPIVEDQLGCCFPIGDSPFVDKEMLIMIRDCDKISDGEKVGIIKYVKEER